MDNCIREIRLSLPGTNREENDSCLAAKNENTFCWIAAPDFIAHIFVGSTESRPTEIN